jgi:hypothetical protein
MFQETAASAKSGDAVFRSAVANRSHSKFRAKTSHLSDRAERTAENPLLSTDSSVLPGRPGWSRLPDGLQNEAFASLFIERASNF